MKETFCSKLMEAEEMDKEEAKAFSLLEDRTSQMMQKPC